MTASRLRSEAGAVAVEFALVFPLAVLMLAFISALGLNVFWSALAENAARSAARYASVPNTAGHWPKGDATVDSMQSVSSQAAGAYGGLLGTPVSVVGSNCHARGTGDETNCDPSTLALSAGFQCQHTGDLLTVRVGYHVPGLTGLQGLVNVLPGLDVTGLATVTHTVRVRCE